jgi:hypothetical protein
VKIYSAVVVLSVLIWKSFTGGVGEAVVSVVVSVVVAGSVVGAAHIITFNCSVY